MLRDRLEGDLDDEFVEMMQEACDLFVREVANISKENCYRNKKTINA